MKDDLTTRRKKMVPLTFNELDDNLERLMYASGFWEAGTHEPNEVVFHEGGLWYCLAQTTDAPSVQSANWFVLAPIPGRGAMRMSTPTAGTDLGAGYQPLDYFDTIQISPIGMVLDDANGLFQFAWPGLWQFTLNLFFNHNNSNSGRTTFARIYNVTDAAAGNGVAIGVARNVEDTSLSVNGLIQVDTSAIGDIFRWEIGGGDAITSITYTALATSFVQLGVGSGPPPGAPLPTEHKPGPFVFDGVFSDTMTAQVDWTSAFSLCYWFNSTNLAAGPTMIGQQGTSTNYRFTQLSTGNHQMIAGGFTEGQNALRSLAATTVDNTWYHVFMDWDGSNFRYFVDNVRITGDGAMTAPTAMTNGMLIGGQRDSTLDFRGQGSDVRYYNRQISDAERQAIFDAALHP